MTDETGSVIHGNLLNNESFQDVSNCDKNNESQQLPNEQLGESWFSPPITSTQIVSFDLISSDGDYSQDELLSGNEKQNILIDFSEDGTISSDEIMQFGTDPAYLLALSPLCDQETNVSETPPPQGKSLNWENRNVTDYLFNSSNLITVGSSNNISIPTVRAPSKRLSLQDKSKKPAKIKKPKVEGYSCKLNGTMYQVFSRDLDVLEAIERGLRVIQEKIRQQGVCNVRPLCLQLNQIETVMGVLENEQLELGMPLEAWKDMMALTKAMFNETQLEVNLCKKRRFELETFTDELTTSFSHSFNISGSEQTKERSSQQLLTFNKRYENTGKNLVRTPDATSHYESQILSTGLTVEIEREENSIQISGVSQQLSDIITQESENEVPKKKSTQTNLRKQRSLKSLKKKSSKKSYAPSASGTFEESYNKSTLPRQNVLRIDSPTDDFRRPDEVDLNLPLDEDSIYERNPLQTTLAIPATDTTIPNSGNYLAICRNTFSSTFNANESLLSENNLLVNDSQLNPGRVTISNCFNSPQQTEEIVTAENVKATNYQDESFIEASQNSTLSLFSGNNRKCLPKIVMMSFNLHPFVLKGVLSPGKNNMKMNINNRIYIGSLTPDGTIEMNGFSFPTIGNWIKSVEGKRFGSLSRTVQKTLELQYNGKSLVEVLDEGGKLNRSVLKENVETSPSNLTQYPTLQAPNADSNLPLKTAPVTQVQNPTSHPQTTDEVGQKNPTSNNDLNTKEDLQLIPDEMTRHIKNIFLHAPDEYFPICQCVEQYWCGAQPFPKHLLDEVDSW